MVNWHEGDLVWAPWRGQPREAVILRPMKTRVRVHLHGIGLRTFRVSDLFERTDSTIPWPRRSGAEVPTDPGPGETRPAA